MDLEKLVYSLDESYFYLNDLNYNKLHSLKEELDNNLKKSRKLDCSCYCGLCEFKYSIIETFILNTENKIKNRRKNPIKQLAQGIVTNNYSYLDL